MRLSRRSNKTGTTYHEQANSTLEDGFAFLDGKLTLVTRSENLIYRLELDLDEAELLAVQLAKTLENYKAFRASLAELRGK